MRDDYIQGIMFSRSNLVDLRRMSRSERMMYKMLATRQALRSWSVKPPSKMARGTAYIAVRSGSHRQQDLQDLAARFKVNR